jgi:hypothetical protein
MPVSFEITINDELPLICGMAAVKVLTAMLTYVAERGELGFQAGGMVEQGDHVGWVDRALKIGDKLTLRVIDAATPLPPLERHRDPISPEEAERQYYEMLKRKYEG